MAGKILLFQQRDGLKLLLPSSRSKQAPTDAGMTARSARTTARQGHAGYCRRSGIGRAIVESFSAEGVKVIATDVAVDKLKEMNVAKAAALDVH